jgi:SAM-dependent methyltransferase
MDLLSQARSHRDAGRVRESLGAYAQLLQARPDATVLVEAADVALRVDAGVAERLATKALELAPASAVAAHHLAEAFARQGRLGDARTLYQRAVAAEGRLADLRHAGARPWTRVDPDGACPSCGADGGELVWVGNATRVQTVFNQLDPVKAWVRCGSCGLVRVPNPPSPESLSAYYAAQRGGAHGLDAPDGRAVVQEVLAWEPLLERIEGQTGGPGRLLEVGAGWGVFLAAAAWRRWDAVGVELSPAAVAFAQRSFRVDVRQAQVPEGLPDGPFDVVALWEVIEHFHRPDDVLAALSARLRPGGVLALSTPDLDHPAHGALGWDDPMWAVPGHLVYYDRSTLEAALRRAGLEPARWWFSARHVGSVGVLARKPG